MPREIPNTPAAPSVTPENPTVTPRIGGTEGTPSAPTQTPIPSGSDSSQNPCDPGQSYTGPYCGWSPSTGGDGGGGDGTSSQPRIGGPQVLGLSNTSGGDLAPSDIIFLTGILCLALYLKSKMQMGKLN